MSLIDKIFEEMANDDADTEAQSAILRQVWEEASPEGQALIDNVLLTLCGWTMSTLLKQIAA